MKPVGNTIRQRYGSASSEYGTQQVGAGHTCGLAAFNQELGKAPDCNGRQLEARLMLLSPDGLYMDKKGGWQYVAHHEDITAPISVPMPDKTMSPITHQAVDDAQKVLEVVTCPSGNSKGSLVQMKKKTQKWLDSLTAGHLHRQMMWFSVDRQLWPSVKYGLCCSMATLPELETILLPFYGKMLPLGGIVCKANPGI
jgi:hypothetical protein